MTANLPASVRQRLRNMARETGVDYNRLQLLYLQERWLARLAQSRHQHNFVLKGGLYLYSNYGLASRPTRDIDFLGRATPSVTGDIVQVISEIATIDLPDGAHFDSESIRGQENQVATEYGGVRVEMIGYLGTARERIRIDIGFGDAIPTGTVPIDFPTLLDEEPPALLAYSFETVIAEKLQAATVLYDVNSRFKDFYDIHRLASSENFDVVPVRRAINATFERRDTRVSDATRLFSPEFSSNKSRQAQWAAFLRRIGERSPKHFSAVTSDLRDFLEPVLNGTATGRWQPAAWRWVEEI